MTTADTNPTPAPKAWPEDPDADPFGNLPPRRLIAEGPDWREWSDGTMELQPPNYGLPADDAPTPPGRDYRAEPLRSHKGARPRPAEVWEAARNDYLAGRTATEVCQRYGIKLGTLRHRAAADGWRRADLPEAAPEAFEPYDDDVDLDAYADADDRDMAAVCRARMARAVYQGDGVAANRWRRMALALEAEARELDAFIAEEEAWEDQHGLTLAPVEPEPNITKSDSSDPVFSDTESDGAEPPALNEPLADGHEATPSPAPQGRSVTTRVASASLLRPRTPIQTS